MKQRYLLILLCMLGLSACNYQKSTLVDIPDAENILVADNGKLFVSGGTNVYQVSKQTSGYQARELLSENCNSTGLAEHNGWVFATCQRKSWFKKRHYLYAADTNKPITQLSLVSQLEGFSLPNGLAFDQHGSLYLADTQFIGSGSVAKASITWSAGKPNLASIQHDWLPANTPNGLAIENNTLFLTDGGDVKRYSLQGQHAVSETILHTESSVLDDLTPFCGGVIVADYLKGRIFFVSADGVADDDLRTGFESIKGASSVAISDGSVAKKGIILVTAKGILGDKWTPIGNKLQSIDVGSDLYSQQQACLE